MARTLIVYRLGSLGDTIVALPCLNRIVEIHPDHRRLVLTNFPVSEGAPSVESILRPGNFVHGAIEYPYGTRNAKLLASLIVRLRSLRPEVLIYLGGGKKDGLRAVRRDLMFFRVAGIRRVIGAPLTSDLDEGHIDQASGQAESEAARLVRCLAELGPIDLTGTKAWDLHLTRSEHVRADETLGRCAGQPFIAVNTGGKVASKDWGDAHWKALLSRLGLVLRAPLVFVGSQQDSTRARMLSAFWGHTVIDTCGRLNPRETAALLGRAALFVGHDSGPMHLAAASGLPCVAMFGNVETPGKWFPYGGRHRVLYDKADVRRISPDAVYQSVLDAWSDNAGRQDAGQLRPLGVRTC